MKQCHLVYVARIHPMNGMKNRPPATATTTAIAQATVKYVAVENGNESKTKKNINQRKSH